MHIVLIANGFQEDYIINLLNSLSGKIERIDFIGSSIYPELKIDSRVHRYNFRSHDENAGSLSKIQRNLSYYPKLLSFLYKSPAKIVHTQWLRFNFFEGVVMTLAIKMLEKKAVYTAHDVLPHSKNNPYNRSVFKLIYKIQDEIIVHSDYIKKRIVNEFHIRPNKITVVKHGLYKITESPALSRDAAREKFGYHHDQLVLLFFGYITKYKGLDLLLEAFTVLQASMPDIRLLIAGKVSQEYRHEYDLLSSQYKSDGIIKIARHIKEEEVESIFKAADVVVLPYREASQSGVLFMSYAYGKPVIAPALGGFPDDIETGKTGLLFEPNNIDSLAATIQEYAGNRNPNGSYIKEYAQRNYSWDASAEFLVQIYKQV